MILDRLVRHLPKTTKVRTLQEQTECQYRLNAATVERANAVIAEWESLSDRLEARELPLYEVRRVV